MKLNRRSFFAALAAAPVVAKATPKVAPPTLTAKHGDLLLNHIAHRRAPKLTAKQQELMDATEREILFTGGRGAGMTFGSARWLEQCASGLWIVKNRGDAQCHMDRFDPEWNINVAGSKVYTPRAVIRIVTADGLDNVRGLRFDRIAFDIPMPWLRWEDYHAMRDYHPEARLLVATPPSSRRSRIPAYFSAEGRRMIHATVLDNPYMGSGYIAHLKMLPDDEHARMVEGKWPA